MNSKMVRTRGGRSSNLDRVRPTAFVRRMMEEAPAQAQHIEDQGQLLELWKRRYKRTGI